MTKLSLDHHFITSVEKEESIIILIHGYGSSKNDLVELCPFFKSLKNTSFYVMNAPFLCDAGFGYQWFALDFSNNDINIVNINEVFNACEYINKFIAEVSSKHNIANNKIGLFGFSQGGILALISSIYSEKNYGAIVCHSGLLIANESKPLNTKQNILLAHGRADEVVKFNQAEISEEFLKQHNFKYETCYIDNLGHSVDEHTINASLQFFIKFL